MSIHYINISLAKGVKYIIGQGCESLRIFLDANYRRTYTQKNMQSRLSTNFGASLFECQEFCKEQKKMCYMQFVTNKYLPLFATGSKVIFPASLTTVLALSDSRLECKKENINLGFILDFIIVLYYFPQLGNLIFKPPRGKKRKFMV